MTNKLSCFVNDSGMIHILFPYRPPTLLLFLFDEIPRRVEIPTNLPWDNVYIYGYYTSSYNINGLCKVLLLLLQLCEGYEVSWRDSWITRNHRWVWGTYTPIRTKCVLLDIQVLQTYEGIHRCKYFTLSISTLGPNRLRFWKREVVIP